MGNSHPSNHVKAVSGRQPMRLRQEPVSMEMMLEQCKLPIDHCEGSALHGRGGGSHWSGLMSTVHQQSEAATLPLRGRLLGKYCTQHAETGQAGGTVTSPPPPTLIFHLYTFSVKPKLSPDTCLQDLTFFILHDAHFLYVKLNREMIPSLQIVLRNSQCILRTALGFLRGVTDDHPP